MSSTERRSARTQRAVFEAIHDAIEADDVRLNGYPDKHDVAEHCQYSASTVVDTTLDLERRGMIKRHKTVRMSADSHGDINSFRPLVEGVLP